MVAGSIPAIPSPPDAEEESPLGFIPTRQLAGGAYMVFVLQRGSIAIRDMLRISDITNGNVGKVITGPLKEREQRTSG